MTIELESVADYESWTGEGPLWHPERSALYWVDLPNGRLLGYDLATGTHEECLSYDGPIGGFTIQDDGDLLLFLECGIVRPWNDADGLGEPIVGESPAERDSRFNDVIADPQGRVFCGTMPTKTPERGGGRLYRLETDGSRTRLLEDLAIPNGMGFTPDHRGFYFSETSADRIYRFDYDVSTGGLSNRDVFVDTSDEPGSPDGMTVDADGYVWSAQWDGGCLVRYAPDGTEDRRVEFPAKKVSSVTFGGLEYQDAYVTTALGPAEDEPGSRESEGSGAGALFRFRTDVGGVPEFRSRIG